jgi:hypothetical protein
LRDHGGGRLIGTELEPAKAAQARANLAAASLDDLVEIRAGDALATLARDLPKTIDLVSSMERKVCTRACLRCSSLDCDPVRCSWPTTPTNARSTSPAS